VIDHASGTRAVDLSTAQVARVLAVNVALTALTAAVVGPAIGKLEGLFGLVGWAGRAPFYLLPLYIGPVVLWARPRLITGLVVGLALSIPLALWSIAARCASFVVVTYVVSGALQGLALAWLAQPRRQYGK
jgi:hypothetical protein